MTGNRGEIEQGSEQEHNIEMFVIPRQAAAAAAAVD